MALSDITQAVLSATESVPSNADENERQTLISALDKLRSAVESPIQRAMRLLLNGSEQTVLTLAVDMNIFDVVAKYASEGETLTNEKLAEETKVDPELQIRIVRPLVALNYLKEVSTNQFTASELSPLFVTGSPLREAVIHGSTGFQTIATLPAYFETAGYTNPADGYDGPHQFAKNTKLHVFDWIAERPRIQHAFNIVMGMQFREKRNWYEFYPVAERLGVTAPDAVALVDVGGGLGHDLAAFRQRHPDLPGRLVFEDLPVVIADARTKGVPAGVEAVAHDFFTPQPVRGARAYYLRTILHDWPEKQARVILGHLRDAMDDDSLLLINEAVVPEERVAYTVCVIDLMMMTMSGLERSEKQWRALFESVGLELVQLWKPQTQGEGTMLLEVRKKRA